MVTQVRQAEAVKQQQPVLRGESQGDTPIGAVKSGKEISKSHSGKSTGSKKTTSTRSDPSDNSCGRCGITPSHEIQCCPARNAVCHRCHRRGHYQIVCKSDMIKKVQLVADDSSDDSFFLGAVGVSHGAQDAWIVTLNVNDKAVDFHIDTGAEVTLISRATHGAIGGPPLLPAIRTLKGPSNNCLPVIGRF